MFILRMLNIVSIAISFIFANCSFASAKVFQAEPGRMLSKTDKSKNHQENHDLFENDAQLFIKIFYLHAQDNRLLPKMLSQEELSKTIVIFWADWCVFCKKFLLDVFPKLFELHKKEQELGLEKTKIIFIKVPEIRNIMKWKNPTTNDFDQAEKTLQYAQQDDCIKSFLLADLHSLEINKVISIPSVIFVKNGIEISRASSCAKSSDILNFKNPKILNDFINIFHEKHEAPKAVLDAAVPEPKILSVETKPINKIITKKIEPKKTIKPQGKKSKKSPIKTKPVSKNKKKKKK